MSDAMKHINPKDIPVPEVHRLLLGGVAPRPIALVSTISEEGINNLSPFSFYNAFGANPPVVAFSPARRGRDASFKDTYQNLIATKECVIQAVTYEMVEQINLASAEFEHGIDEFVKSGLTPIDSEIVKPKRVKESPFQMECKLLQMINLGNDKASGNLAICEVIRFHIDENVFDDGIIHPDLIDLVSRMGGDFYCRASKQNIFEIEKPLQKKIIGYDNLPSFIKESTIYTANNLGKFGNSEVIPAKETLSQFVEKYENHITKNNLNEDSFISYETNSDIKNMLITSLTFQKRKIPGTKQFFERTAKKALEMNQSDFAWKCAMLVDFFNL